MSILHSAHESDAASRRSSRHVHILVLCVVGAVLSLMMFLHGAQLWYVPIGFILGHGVVLVGVGLVVSRIARQRPGNEHAGQQIHHPWLYDRLVRAFTLGREKQFRQWVIGLGKIREDQRVLDVGCGTGSHLIETAMQFGSGVQLYGIEPSAEMVDHARKKAKSAGVAMTVVQGSADELSYPDESFDVVFCTLVLHHLPESMREQAIREMRRVLRSGGRLVIVEVQKPTKIRGLVSLISILHGHVKHEEILDIEPLLRELGFKDIARHVRGSGAIGAIVGHLAVQERIMDQPSPKAPAAAPPNTQH